MLTLQREIERLQDAKRRALQIADERAKEAAALRQDPIVQMVRIWRECPEEKRPSVEALLDRIRTELASPNRGDAS
ncbi:hypothetical protein QA640_17950 [Bradyrhizobium sp. CB82]|uniref:hypothetical protein n=1 Tax=Bradyrhizobium sp. CB82 TaxID=3039159 RepID=UPI0024B1CEAC|nr:hypothetical protein [Bradyrhizobium sp. CB82]WFU44163.1 hypothetical protein QA640_17950 [Bradyrhizobium sp. CB82]